MLRRLGAARHRLWVAELTDGLAERNRRAIWGGDERARRIRPHQPRQPAARVTRVQGGGEGVKGDRYADSSNRSITLITDRSRASLKSRPMGLE